MYCSKCNQLGEFICRCDFLILCPIHLPLHLSETGHNSIECLNITLGSLEFEALRDEALIRIKALQHSIEDINAFSKAIIKKFKSSSKAAIKKIQNQVQVYLKLISLRKYSESLKKEVDKVFSTTLSIKTIPESMNTSIENIFNVDFSMLFNIKEKEKKIKEVNKSLERELNEPKISEKEVGDKNQVKDAQEKNEREKVDKKISNEGEEEKKRNESKNRTLEKAENKKLKETDIIELTLDKKIQYLKSLGFLNWKITEAKEIKFSRDLKFAFICKIYSGNFK